MNILFFNLSGLKFDVGTPEREPLGGSESCVCYLARQLQQLGHNITLFAHRPDGAPETVMGVRHFHPSLIKDKDFVAAQKFDVIITNNAPIAAPFLREASPSSFILLWDHVMPDQQAMKEMGNAEVLNSLDGIIYISAFQRTETEKAFGIKKPCAIIGNGLTPAFSNMFTSADEILKAKQNRAAYTTTPFRGLPFLLEAMKGIDTGTELDIYSSMRVYQVTGEKDHYAPLYEEAKASPAVHYHGSVPQAALAEKLRNVAFLTYPCVYVETFCIAALEAMAAGMEVLTTRLGALPDTTMGYAGLIDVEPGNADALTRDFRALMKKHINAFKADPRTWAEKMFTQSQKVNRECNWAVRAAVWEKLFNARGF